MNTNKFDVDVLVAGGGVAGVSAALSAARSSSSSRLIVAFATRCPFRFRDLSRCLDSA